jgi:hypothetical protein
MSDNTLVAAELAELRVENKALRAVVATRDFEITTLNRRIRIMRLGANVGIFTMLIIIMALVWKLLTSGALS